jgi:hypothetical protein
VPRALLLTVCLLASLPASAEPFKALVLDFQPEGVRPAIARLATELIAAELSNLDGLEVMTKSDLKTIAELEGEKQAAGCDENSCLAEIAGALGARYVIYGDVLLVKPRYTLTVKRFDAKRAKVDQRVVRVVERAADFPEAVSAVVPRLMKDLEAVTVPSSVALTAKPTMRTKAPPPALKPAADASLFGAWDVAGTYNAGGAYRGKLTVTDVGGGRVKTRWKLKGEPEVRGAGLILGGRLYVAWNAAGVAVFDPSDGGLEGVFAAPDESGFGRERGRRVSGFEVFSGIFDVSGESPQGKRYRNRLTLRERTEGVYAALWESPGGGSNRGLGLVQEGRLVVGYGRDARGVIAYRAEGDRLVGRWIDPNGGGVETLTRAKPAPEFKINKVPDVSGTWKVRGTHPNGGPYAGSADITRRPDGRVRADISIPGATYVAWGFMLEDKLLLSWESIWSGVTVYELTDDGLAGVFSRVEREGFGREAGVRKSGAGFTGTFRIKGVHSDGKSEFQNVLTLTEKNDVYTAVWKPKGGKKEYGFGFVEGDRLVLAYGLSCEGLAVFTHKGDELDGRWVGRYRTIGKEVFTRTARPR